MVHFDNVANEWDSPQKVKLIKLTASKIKEGLAPLKNQLNILDFGCGTGLLAAEFLDHAASVIGIDTSDGMLQVFDEKFKDLDFVSSKNINLEIEKLDVKFDLIISSMVFHHLDKPSDALKTLSHLLSENGVIAIVDLDQEDGTFHPDNEAMGVKHYGFSKDELISWAKDSKIELKHSIAHHIEKNEREYNLFLGIFKK